MPVLRSVKKHHKAATQRGTPRRNKSLFAYFSSEKEDFSFFKKIYATNFYLLARGLAERDQRAAMVVAGQRKTIAGAGKI
jgi:hypothetical protein